VQGVSRFQGITAGGDFLSLCDQKSSYKPVSDFAEVTHFSVRGTPCTRGLYIPLCRLMSRRLQHSPSLRQPYRVLRTAPGCARGGHFSKGLAGYNIDNVQQFLKNTCSAY
jgi:hypothetical protein